jgi:hypothetical protein
MPAIQPIPVNKPNTTADEAARVLALHNRSTDGRTRTPRWNPSVRRGAVAGENSGTKKA